MEVLVFVAALLLGVVLGIAISGVRRGRDTVGSLIAVLDGDGTPYLFLELDEGSDVDRLISLDCVSLRVSSHVQQSLLRKRRPSMEGEGNGRRDD